MTNHGLDGQFRIDHVQVLNWGAYSGLQVMAAGRASTALLGPSGRGKSTLLDAIASVIMPNPQEFNQAARDDKGSKRERTMYSYARGLTVSHEDEGSRSTTPSYLRGADKGGFVSGAAITWATGHDKRVTALRVAWVSTQATDNESIANSTVYGFVHDDFPLSRLNGLTPMRGGTSPISPATIAPLINAARGDIVSTKQSAVHTAMRSTMQMGRTDESQRLAMQLLRRAQASKGIYSINDLFRDFVLTEPDAIRRWDVTMEHYTEATRLFEEFELARKKTETLKGLPDTADQYRTAGADARAKRELLREDDQSGQVARLRVWHAAKVLEWVAREQERLAVERALLIEELDEAAAEVRIHESARERALEALTGAEGDRSALLRERITHAKNEEQQVWQRRRKMTDRLAQFDTSLPTSSGDVSLTRTLLKQMAVQLETDLGQLRSDHEAAAARRSQLGEAITSKKRDLGEVTKLGGNIPPDAHKLRLRIAAGAGVAADRLRYVGELLDIPPSARAWQHAILRIIRPLASDLMVPQDDFRAVRAYVNNHDIQGDITLVAAQEYQQIRQHPAGTVAAMLEVVPGPYQGWISGQLRRFTFLCVERDTDLDGPLPTDVVGRVTRAGMRTAANGRLKKADSPQRFRWIGRDNSDLLAELRDEITGLGRAFDASQILLGTATLAVDEHQAKRGDLDRLLSDLQWPELDLAPVQEQLRQLQAELDLIDTPEQRERRAAYNAADEKLDQSKHRRSTAQNDLDQIAMIDGAIMVAEDDAKDLLDQQPPLTDDETTTLVTLALRTPELNTTGLTDTNADDRIRRAIRDTYTDAQTTLISQIQQHDERRRNLEQTLTANLRAYRNINDRTHREVDDTIDSLPALEAIYDQLITDDLPRARTQWLSKVNADLNQALRTVDRQIEVDRRSITKGLDPINTALDTVPFRNGSRLQITAVDQPNIELHQFRAVVRRFTQDNPLGEDLFNDDAKVEASFRRLHTELAKLNDASRAGRAWRLNVFDARNHVAFHAIETPADGKPIVHEGVSGMSGGEGQELIAFILGAALRYRLGEGGATMPTYGTIVLDEGFVKADSEYTGRSLRALQALGFQLIVGAPREKATAFEDYVDLVAYITNNPDNPAAVQIHSLTIEEALAITEGAA